MAISSLHFGAKKSVIESCMKGLRCLMVE